MWASMYNVMYVIMTDMYVYVYILGLDTSHKQYSNILAYTRYLVYSAITTGIVDQCNDYTAMYVS